MAEKGSHAHPWLMERRYFSLIIVLAFLILSTITFFICLQHHRINTEQTLKEDRSAANLLSLFLNEHLNKLFSVMESYVQRPLLLQAVGDKNVEKAMVHLINLKKSNPDVDILVITNREGTLWVAYPERPELLGKNLAHRDWYKNVSKEWKADISDVVLRIVREKDLAFQISVPFVNEKGEVIGILMNTQRTAGLSYLFKPVLLDPGTFIAVTDRKGQIIYDSRRDVETAIRSYPFHSAMKKAMVAKKKTFAVDDPDIGGEERYISFAPVANIGWAVFVERDKRSILLSETAYYIQVTAIAFLLFLSIVLLLFYSRKQVTAQQLLEQLQAEEKIHRLNAELEQRVLDRTAQLSAANRELKAFSYSVSHDLRGPLRGIDGFSQALLEDYGDKLDETGRNYLERVRKATQHMGWLIDDMLKLSRVSQSEFHRQTVDLSSLVQAIADNYQQRNPDRAVEVIVQEGIMVQGDPYMMKIAMENLISNAWKFTGKVQYPLVEFGVTAWDGNTACFIRDNGAGFDMTYAGKLFGAFQRLHTVDEFPGTGIGLATVQRVIHRHGGRIWAEGEIGKGATFTFTVTSGQAEVS